jgi:hypothetical protein
LANWRLFWAASACGKETAAIKNARPKKKSSLCTMSPKQKQTQTGTASGNSIRLLIYFPMRLVYTKKAAQYQILARLS